MANAKIDNNGRASLTGINETTGAIQALLIDDATGALLVTGTFTVGNLNDIGDVNVGTPGVGDDGKALTWDNGTGKFVLTSSGSGDVSKVGTPVDNQIGVWTGDGTIEGTSSLTFDGSNLLIVGDLGITGTRIIKGWFTDLEVTNGIVGSITGNSATVTTITGLAPDTATTQATQPNITSIANLDTVGTITTGTWSATTIDVNKGGTGQTSYTNGELLIGNTTGNTIAPKTLSGDVSSLTNAGLVTLSATNTNLTTLANLTTVGTVTTGNVDAVVSDSSLTAKGKVELATTSEIDTGTDSTRAIPVDQFKASKRNIRWLVFNLVEAGTDCAIATNIAGDFVSPIAGTILQSDTTPFYLYATNSTAGTTGTMVVDISIGGTSIMTTNKLDFDTTEKTTTTAATPPDLTTTSLAVGDIITIDIDSIHTTAAKGLTVYIAIRE